MLNLFHRKHKTTITTVLLGLFLAMFYMMLIPSTAEAYRYDGYRFTNRSADIEYLSSYTDTNSGWTGRADNSISSWYSSFPYTRIYSNINTELGTASFPASVLGFTNVNYNSGTYIINWFRTDINTGTSTPYFDGTQNGGIIPSNYYDLQTIVSHELGHGLGLCHPEDYNTVMAKYTIVGAPSIRAIDTDSRNGANDIYINGAGRTPTCYD